jgi:GTP1/Obg family GTP-binding protein
MSITAYMKEMPQMIELHDHAPEKYYTDIIKTIMPDIDTLKKEYENIKKVMYKSEQVYDHYENLVKILREQEKGEVEAFGNAFIDALENENV